MKNYSGLLYGLIAGLITVTYFLLFYTVNPRIMLGSIVWWSSLVIYLIAMVLAVKKRASKAENYITLRSALQTGFLVFVIANLLFYTFFYLLFGLFDPSLVDLQKEMMSANPAVADELNTKDFSVTLSGTFFNYLYSLIGGFLLALGIAAVMKSD